MTIHCAQCVELLPWLLNESLDDGERVAVLGHLQSCSDCQREWEETKRSAWMLEQHVPSRVLVDHVLGLGTPYPSQLVENHLLACASCCKEAETMTAEKQIVLMKPKAKQGRPAETSRVVTQGRQGWLVAASLAAAVLTVLLWSSPQSSEPTGGSPPIDEASTLADSTEIAGEGYDQAALEGTAQSNEDLHADSFDSGGLGSWSHIENSGQDPTG